MRTRDTLAVIGVLIAAAIVTAGCAAGSRQATVVAPRQQRGLPDAARVAAARPSAGATTAAPRFTPNYASPDGKSEEEHIAAFYHTLKNPGAIIAKMSIAFTVPSRIGTDRQTRSRALKNATDTTELGVVDFEGNRRISIERFKDENQAREWVTQDEDDPDFAPQVKVVRIGQFEGRAIDKLDIGPIDNADGTKVVGTGIFTGAAQVRWNIGKFGISVLDEDGGIDELVADVQAAWPSK